MFFTNKLRFGRIMVIHCKSVAHCYGPPCILESPCTEHLTKHREHENLRETSLRRSSSDHSTDAARSLLRSGAGDRYDRKATAIDGTYRQTDTRPLHRPSTTHHSMRAA